MWLESTIARPVDQSGGVDSPHRNEQTTSESSCGLLLYIPS
jgi:hypothetical protein